MRRILLSILISVSVLVFGCCGATTPSGYGSCPTYSGSCQKSCVALAAEEGADQNQCVVSCNQFWVDSGIDPGSCCSSEETIRAVCEIECSFPDNDFGSGSSCMENCGQAYYGYTSLGLDDCVAPY